MENNRRQEVEILIKQLEDFRFMHRTFAEILAKKEEKQKEELICSLFAIISGARQTSFFYKSMKTGLFQFSAAAGEPATNYSGGYLHGDLQALSDAKLTASSCLKVEIKTPGTVYDFKDKFIMVLPVFAFAQLQGILLCEYDGAYEIDDPHKTEMIGFLLVQFAMILECFVETQRWEEKAKSLELLYEIGSALSSIRDENKLLEAILKLVEKYLLVDRCSLMIIDDKRTHMTIKKAFGMDDVDIRTVKVPLGVGIAGRVATAGQPLLVNDITSESGLVSQVQHREDFRTNSLLSVPLVAQGEIIGVINVNNRKDGLPFSDEDMELLNKIASEIATVLQRSYMGLQLKKARELENEIKRFMPM